MLDPRATPLQTNTVTADEERLAEAIAVHQRFGEKGAVFIAARIGALALAGDDAGVERWRSIARHYAQHLLPKGPVQ